MTSHDTLPLADKSVAVIGLGIMGGNYARHLLHAGFDVRGCDIDAEKTHALALAGGKATDSVADAIKGADVVITALSSATAFKSVMCDIVTRCAQPGQLFIETGTLSLAMKHEARCVVEAAGARMLDTPVTGTRVHAEKRELVVYASGALSDFKRAEHILSAFARDVRFVGPFGVGSKLKFITNHLVAVHNVATAETLSLAQAAGLDLALVYELIASGPARSEVFGFRGPLMVEGRYDDPTMRMDVFEKDIDIIGQFAQELGAAIPLLQSSTLLYKSALAQGITDEDVSAVFRIFTALSRKNTSAH